MSYDEKYRKIAEKEEEESSLIIALSLWIQLNRWLEEYHHLQVEKSKSALSQLLNRAVAKRRKELKKSWDDIALEIGFHSREALRRCFESNPKPEDLLLCAKYLYPSLKLSFAALKLADFASIFPQFDLFSLSNQSFKLYLYCLFYRPRFSRREVALIAKKANLSFKETKVSLEQLEQAGLVLRNGEEYRLIFDLNRGITLDEMKGEDFDESKECNLEPK